MMGNKDDVKNSNWFYEEKHLILFFDLFQSTPTFELSHYSANFFACKLSRKFHYSWNLIFFYAYPSYPSVCWCNPIMYVESIRKNSKQSLSIYLRRVLINLDDASLLRSANAWKSSHRKLQKWNIISALYLFPSSFSFPFQRTTAPAAGTSKHKKNHRNVYTHAMTLNEPRKKNATKVVWEECVSVLFCL